MTDHEPKARAGRATRVFGYLVAVGVNLLLLYLVNISPGWEVVPFLDDDGVPLVLGLFNLSLLANAAANLAYVVYDARWFKAALNVGLSMISVWLGIRVLEVFPVDFTGLSYDLTTLARVVFEVGLVGSVIGLVVALVTFAREVYRAAGGAR